MLEYSCFMNMQHQCKE